MQGWWVHTTPQRHTVALKRNNLFLHDICLLWRFCTWAESFVLMHVSCKSCLYALATETRISMRAGEPGGRGMRGGGRKPVFPLLPVFVVRSFSGVGAAAVVTALKWELGRIWVSCGVAVQFLVCEKILHGLNAPSGLVMLAYWFGSWDNGFFPNLTNLQILFLPRVWQRPADWHPDSALQCPEADDCRGLPEHVRQGEASSLTFAGGGLLRCGHVCHVCHSHRSQRFQTSLCVRNSLYS